jgi:hypothetical protein
MQRGDKAAARRLLADTIQADPHSGTAWLWLSAVLDDLKKQRYCVDRALKADPTNAIVHRRWSWLHGSAQPATEAWPAQTTDSLSPLAAPEVRAQASPVAESGSRVKPRDWVAEWLAVVGVLALVMIVPVLSYWIMTGEFVASWPYAWAALATGIVLSGLMAWLADRGAERTAVDTVLGSRAAFHEGEPRETGKPVEPTARRLPDTVTVAATRPGLQQKVDARAASGAAPR